MFFAASTFVEATDVCIFAGIPKRNNFYILVFEYIANVFGISGIIVNKNDMFERVDIARFMKQHSQHHAFILARSHVNSFVVTNFPWLFELARIS